MTLARTICTGVCVLCCAVGAHAGITEVRVISVTPRSVFIDEGTAAGVRVGMEVTLYPVTRAPFQAVVINVSRSSARAEVPLGFNIPAVGTRGEIDLPDLEERVQESGDEKEESEEVVVEAGPPAPASPAPGRTPVEHPPWTRKGEERTGDQPLLAPAFQIRPEDRAIRFDGKIFTRLQYSKDLGGQRNSVFYVGSTGSEFEIENLFGNAGILRFEGRLLYRGVDLTDRNETDRRIRIDEVSYSIGEQEYAPYRVQVGRFYSRAVPEIGLIDGVESEIRMENGVSIGGAVGAYPVPFPEETVFDDYGFHIYARYENFEERYITASIAYQKTWHDGKADRDLIIGRASIRPGGTLWLNTSFKADIYTGDDEIKDKSIDLTELYIQASMNPTSNTGVNLSYFRFTWPDLIRDEFRNLPIELIRDGKIDRFSGSAWVRVTRNLRLSGRANYWEDQNTDGNGAEIAADWSSLFGAPVSLHTALFYTRGASTEGTGVRVQARPRVGRFYGLLGYEHFIYSQVGLVTGSEDLTRQTLRVGLDWRAGRWRYSLNGDYRFGDRENNYVLGLFAEYRF